MSIQYTDKTPIYYYVMSIILHPQILCSSQEHSIERRTRGEQSCVSNIDYNIINDVLIFVLLHSATLTRDSRFFAESMESQSLTA